ncbi:MAG: class I SAM-dependent methyltransferase [Rhodospirillaceae bacterium]|nr:class I SAM-dependent methyltransferase [Rhodospirillaceae bacterium]
MADKVSSAYNQWSATYDQVANKTRDLSAKVLRSQSLPLNGATVIEMGCGTGLNTAYLAVLAGHVTALDFSEGMMAQAKTKVASDRVIFKQCDITQGWPVSDQTADVVVGNLVLEHIADLSPVFAHAFRALKPGGQMFVCELHSAKQMLGKKAVFTDTATGQDVDFPAYFHDVSDYANAALSVGFQIVQMNEWRDDDSNKMEPPRLITFRFVKP